jgi:hypothetical protein
MKTPCDHPTNVDKSNLIMHSKPKESNSNFLESFQNFINENQEGLKDNLPKTPTFDKPKENIMTNLTQINQNSNNNEQIQFDNNNSNNNNKASVRNSNHKHSFIDQKKSTSSQKSRTSSKKEDIIITYLANSNLVINNEIIQSSPKLTMYIDDNDIFVNGETKIEINASGLINGGGRNAKDGIVIFGGGDSENITTPIKPDIELNYQNNINLKQYQHYPYVFAIYFQKESKNYFLRAYSGEGSDNMILFIKLTYGIELPLKQKEFLAIGNSIFQITPLKNDNLEIHIIAGYPYVNDNNNTPTSIEPRKFFDKNEINEITIGRDSKCTYPFKTDNSFSRIQTTIGYENGSWIIRDGTKFKPSKNGTWLFGLHSFPIKDDLTVEALSTKIRFRLKE